MKKLILINMLLAFIILFSGSCVSRKKLTYLQFSSAYDVSDRDAPGIESYVTPSVYQIKPYDILYIRVITPDPQWSALFNMSAGGAAITQESASLFGYNVDIEGNIEIPYVGKLQVAGNTLSQIKSKLDSTFTNYLNDADITVKLVNNSITIIGEVTAPGRYPITRDRINVFEAIAMAGDLRDFSDRQEIQLIRPTKYGPVIKEFTLLDRSILNSEFYYIMPNDIIYAKPMRGRTFQMNASIYSTILGFITTIITFTLLFSQ